MRTKKLRHLAGILICFICVTGTGLAADMTQHDAGESISGFSFAIVEDNSQKSIIEGTKGNFISEKVMQLADVVCSIYQNDTPTLTIETPAAQADTDKGIVTSDQKVVFTNPKGMNITGTGMRWDTKAQTIIILKNIDSIFPSTMFAEDAPDDKK